MIKYILFIFISAFFSLLVFNPSPYNTEQICFDDEGNIVFYEQGFNPNKTPLIKLTNGIYKNISTGEKINAICKWSWGASKPKGRKYWETNYN